MSCNQNIRFLEGKRSVLTFLIFSGENRNDRYCFPVEISTLKQYFNLKCQFNAGVYKSGCLIGWVEAAKGGWLPGITGRRKGESSYKLQIR